MSKPAILKGGPYHGTVGEITRSLPVLKVPETGAFAYVLTTPQPDDAPALEYQFNEDLSPAVQYAKQHGLWDPTEAEESN